VGYLWITFIATGANLIGLVLDQILEKDIRAEIIFSTDKGLK
jgi:hypothetical protein